MKNVIFAAIPMAALLFCATANAASNPLFSSAKARDPLATTRIVGGVEAEQANWPWMTAFVVTFDEVLTSLTVGAASYETESFNFGPAGEASAPVINCAIGDTVCAGASDNICLIERGEINFSEKANNCQAGGGVGVIIYNNIDGLISGTLGDDFTGTIPVVAITQNDGLRIIAQIAGNATVSANISVSASTALAQDSSCGATFLGDKWVVTAAHCVDSPSASRFKMNVGEFDLSDGADNAIDIANIYIHPLFDADSFNNDIAIVELVSSVNIQGVQIADSALTEQLAIENSVATVAGWGGSTGYAPGEGPTSDFPDILHQVELRLSTNQECRALMGNGVSDAMICAGVADGGRGSCQGDSGGPLIVNTGTGPQQVGIVSWGVGCAQADLPGVYTRISEFTDWLDTISNGVAITQRHDFAIGLQGETQNTVLQVNNNSELDVALSFALEGSDSFTVDGSNCANLAVNASCEVTVSYAPTTEGETSAELIITADSGETLVSKALISGNAVGNADQLVGIAGPASEFVSWFSGGDLPWVENSLEGVQSGNIADVAESILAVQIEGEGQLNFDWAVSSEENTDEPDDPFDTLTLFINGEQVGFISGEVSFVAYPTIDLSPGTNVISWIYAKDLNTSDGDDQARVRNVTFTPPVVVTPTPVPRPVQSGSSGGGSAFWLSLPLLFLMFFRRRKLSVVT